MPGKDHAVFWDLEQEELLKGFGTSLKGLTTDEARLRLKRDGLNDVQGEKNVPAWRIFINQFASPLVLILIFASAIAFAMGDITETVIIVIMLFLSGILGFIQEYRSERALRLLRTKLTRYATVKRSGKLSRIDARELVRGDIVMLDTGNVIPADLRLIGIEDLEIDESAITGESVPVPKIDEALMLDHPLPQELVNMAFMGTHVVQGSGVGLVVQTGTATEVGRTATLLTQKPEETDFQKGMRQFGNFLLKITLGLAFVVALTLGLLRGNWPEAMLFALALAVGISPELLPVIITINLSRGALLMSRKHVLVKKLIAIEDLGNSDVFCTDKTGTLTVGQLRVRGAIDTRGRASTLPLAHAVHCLDLTAAGKTSNPIDQSILEAGENKAIKPVFHKTKRLDIISFDFQRRRMSCVISQSQECWLITKGAVKETLDICTSSLTEDGVRQELHPDDRKRLMDLADGYHDQGYRLIAVARRPIVNKHTYGPGDEKEMSLIGFILVSDAPKRTARPALATLKRLGARIAILTGDNERITRHVAEQLGFEITGILTGDEIERMTDGQLRDKVEKINVFARITPSHKLRIIQAFKRQGHTVGFMGDGINDAPALHAADCGISFDCAVDVAKEAADVIMLKKNLSVLADGIREGRKTFMNTRTYINATIASNFGNMLSVAGSSLVLPFLPLLPVQIILLNLLSDAPMLAISGDRVADEDLAKPKRWDLHQISGMMYFFGTISSLADFAMFGILLYAAHAQIPLFRSAWFLESMLTEVVIIFLLRTRRLSFTNRPGTPLLLAAGATILITLFILQSSLGATFELVPLQPNIILVTILVVLGYIVLTELGKRVYFRYIEKMEPGHG